MRVLMTKDDGMSGLSRASTWKGRSRGDVNMQLWWRELVRKCVRQILTPIYRIYEHRLVRQVRAFPIPGHIALILDGNRRFGRQTERYLHGRR
jgi:hypothetical protein